MIALFNERGAAYAWLHTNGTIYGLEGKALAFVDGDGVYDWEGAHIAWWADGHMRDWLGAVCLFSAAAKNLLVVKPVCATHQQKPLQLETRTRPRTGAKLAPPPRLCLWTAEMPV